MNLWQKGKRRMLRSVRIRSLKDTSLRLGTPVFLVLMGLVVCLLWGVGENRKLADKYIADTAKLYVDQINRDMSQINSELIYLLDSDSNIKEIPDQITSTDAQYYEMEQTLRELGLPRSPHLDVRQYIYDMDVVMAAADVVLCRAGASTISELTALGKPTVMVPSPYVTNNHQEKNARLLETHGGAVVITEPEATGGGLYDAVSAILSDSEKRSSMARAMKELGIPDATERIYDTVMALVK